MKKKADPRGDAAELRRRAEEIARQEAAQTPKKPKALSLEETRRTLYELRTHQIELEMQNEELKRAQVELETARARYFDLYDLAPVGYFTLSEQGLILEANLTAADLLGLARAALARRPITRFILDEDQDLYYLRRKQLIETGTPQTCELRMVRKDGTRFWAHLTSTRAQDAAGAAVCRVAMSDITERKFREDEREFAAHLVGLTGSPGDFRACLSDLAASLHAWSGCEAVGIRLRDGDDYPYCETRGFPPAFVRMENQLCAYGPDGKILRDGVGNPVLECMCGNILCGRFDAAKPFFTSHGSFWTNSTTALLASTSEAGRQGRTLNRCNGAGYESVALIPLRASGQVFGLLQLNDHRPDRFTLDLIAHFERIADGLAAALLRRQTEEALRESESRYRTIFGELPVAIWEEDFSGVKLRFDELRRSGVNDFRSYLDANPDEVAALAARVSVLKANQASVELFGADGAEHLARELTRYFTNDSLAVFKDELIALAEEKRTFRATIPNVNSKGDRLLLDLALSVPTEHAEDLSSVLVSFVDITRQQQMEEQLRQAQKMETVGQLAGGVAHNFNNMLQVIIGNVKMALEKVEVGQPLQKHLLEVHRAARRSAEITGQLLAFARKQMVSLKVVDLNETVAGTRKMIQRLIGEGTDLAWIPGRDLWKVMIDPAQLDQVLANLAENARDAIGGVGRLTVETKNVILDEGYCAAHAGLVPGEYVQLSVSDDGCGMDRETLSHLFEPFFTTKGPGKGTGLGLATIYGIVKQNDGFIEVGSEPGQGSTFKVYLPRVEGAEAVGRADG